MSYFVQKATQNSFKLANTDTINNIIRIGTAPPPNQVMILVYVFVQESRVSEIVICHRQALKLKRKCIQRP